MNSITRTWLTWKHRRKFARLGERCQFPIPDLHIEGHVEMGDLCRLRNNVTLRAHPGGRIIFGNRSGCSWHCLFDARSEIRIGNYTAIAEFTCICDSIRPLAGNDRSWKEAAPEARPVLIGDNCFVGSACYIGPGVTIGEGAVIAHHSIVLDEVGPFEIWGGAPARRMGHRVKDVPESRLREYQELVARYGLQKDRYLDE